MLQTLKLNNEKKEKIFVLVRKKFGWIDSWDFSLLVVIHKLRHGFRGWGSSKKKCESLSNKKFDTRGRGCV